MSRFCIHRRKGFQTSFSPFYILWLVKNNTLNKNNVIDLKKPEQFIDDPPLA